MKKASCWRDGQRRLTQWGSSWGRERSRSKPRGMQKPQFAGGVARPGRDNRDAKTAKELWKTVKK